ncbi:MAG: hypothetical protein HWN68_16720 [Desulfobacterales bacterium]|nr:hypothetical protein [Desulfobacterales bacterium]
MDTKKVYKAAYQIVMDEPLTVELTAEEFQEAQRIAQSLCCQSCGG